MENNKSEEQQIDALAQTGLSIFSALGELLDCAEKNTAKHDIETAVGEIPINGVKYQIQMSLVCNPEKFIGENEVAYTNTKMVSQEELNRNQ